MSKKEVHKVNLEELNEEKKSTESDKKNSKLEDITSVGDVELPVRVEFSRVKKTIEEALEFETGDIVKLDRFDGEDVDICVGEVLVAKGEITVMDDKFAVRITDFVPSDKKF